MENNTISNLVERIQCAIVRGMVLFILFALVSCEQSNQQQIPPGLSEKIKRETGLDLPISTKLIYHKKEEGRSNADRWMFEFAHSNKMQYAMDLIDVGDARDNANFMEREGNISIRNPVACFYGNWLFSSNGCAATLITTSNSDYLMLNLYD